MPLALLEPHLCEEIKKNLFFTPDLVLIPPDPILLVNLRCRSSLLPLALFFTHDRESASFRHFL